MKSVVPLLLGFNHVRSDPPGGNCLKVATQCASYNAHKDLSCTFPLRDRDDLDAALGRLSSSLVTELGAVLCRLGILPVLPSI